MEQPKEEEKTAGEQARIEVNSNEENDSERENKPLKEERPDVVIFVF